MELPTNTIILLIIGVITIVLLAGIFLFGLQLSPLDARRTFANGCMLHCAEIYAQSDETGQPIGLAAVEKGHELEGSTFIRACNFLYPETTGYPYLCWLQDCCRFELPPP